MWVAWSGTQDGGVGGSFGAVTGRQWNGVASNQILGLSGSDPDTAVVNWRPYSPDVTLTGVTAVGDGTWRHVVITYTSGEHKLYVDGKLEASDTTTGTTTDNATGSMPLYLGAWGGDGGAYSTALIDDVRVYDHVLTEGEVKALVPEPSTVVLSVFGLLGLAIAGGRRRKR